MKKVLFVCMGNICRSPAAEAVFASLVEARGLQEAVACDSAGTLDYHTGSPPDARMGRALRSRGISPRGTARQVTPADLETFDLVLTMDRNNLAGVRALDPEGRHADKIRPFCEYLREHEATEVPDPYYGGAGGFEYVMDLLEDGCTALLEELSEEPEKPAP